MWYTIPHLWFKVTTNVVYYTILAHDPVVQIVDLLDDDRSDKQSNQTQVPPVQVSKNKRSYEQEVKSNHWFHATSSCWSFITSHS